MASRYRFLIVQPYELTSGSDFNDPYLSEEFDRERRMRMNLIPGVKEMLEDVDWEFHGGPKTPFGNFSPANREELSQLGALSLPIIRQACESGKYNAIVLLGGAEPSFFAGREICQGFRIPVTACAHSQVHIAKMLGNKFTVIDSAEVHARNYYDIIGNHRMAPYLASIRPLFVYNNRPGRTGLIANEERDKALRGEATETVENAVKAAIAAITEDGAETLILGCSNVFWLRPFLISRLRELGWNVPVLEGYTSAIAVARMMVDLNVCVSSLMYPVDNEEAPIRRRKIV